MEVQVSVGASCSSIDVGCNKDRRASFDQIIQESEQIEDFVKCHHCILYDDEKDAADVVFSKSLNFKVLCKCHTRESPSFHIVAISALVCHDAPSNDQFELIAEKIV